MAIDFLLAAFSVGAGSSIPLLVIEPLTRYSGPLPIVAGTNRWIKAFVPLLDQRGELLVGSQYPMGTLLPPHSRDSRPKSGR